MRRMTFPLMLLAMVMAAIAPARAQDVVAEDRSSPSMLAVELVINGRPTGDIVAMRTIGGKLLVDPASLRRNGAMVAGTGEVDLAATGRISAHYDVELQRLELLVPTDLMPLNQLGRADAQRMPTVADWGAMLNYDAYMQRAGGRTSAAIWTEQRIFGPVGVFSNTGTLRLSNDFPGAKGYLRYDSQLRMMDEERALTFTAGDLITRSLPWTTSVRIGGIALGRDFSVRPDLLTMPLPSFAGQSAVPAAVDLFIDGAHAQSGQVEAGRFVLDNVPVVNGAGMASVVTTDAVGRQFVATAPFYVSSELLKAGFVDFSAELGMLRKDYGIRSFSYGQAVASGTVRRGLSSRLTAEVHGEASRLRQMAGGGLIWAPFRIGVVQLSGAISHSRSGDGTFWSVGYSYISRRFSISAQHQERGHDFRDLGSFDLTDYRTSSRMDRLIASVNLDQQGSVGLAYVGGSTLNGASSRLATLSYSRPLGRRASLFASADRDFHRGVTCAQLRVILSFGRNSVNSGITRSGDGLLVAQAAFSRAVPTDGGVGLSAGAGMDDRGGLVGQGSAALRTSVAQFELGASTFHGRKSIWGSASGSLVTMDRDVFAANQVTDAFAVVSSGAPNVRVSYENQPVGVTNRRGHLLVAGVTSQLPVRFDIDTLSLSADQMATTVERRMAIRRGAGAMVSLPVRRVRSVIVMLVDEDNRPLPPGLQASRPGRDDAEVGWDGVVYLEDVENRTELAVRRGDGSTCRAKFDLPADSPPMAKIGPVPCV